MRHLSPPAGKAGHATREVGANSKAPSGDPRHATLTILMPCSSHRLITVPKIARRNRGRSVGVNAYADAGSAAAAGLLDYGGSTAAVSVMENVWQDFGLWFLGLLVMALGIAFPIYLFHSEGADSLFGNIVYVVAGVLLFLAGLGITFYRTWMAENRAAQA